MKKIVIFSAFFSVCALSAAQADKANGQSPDGSEQAPQKTVTRFDFDNEKVEGSIQRPNGDTVDGIRKLRQSSMVKPRANFIPEMYKSVDSL